MIYAIVGGPSSGKTSIIKELERQGEQVIQEAATDWIRKKIEMGVTEPWKEEGFVLDILQLQLEREAPWISKEGNVFVDRGIFDVYPFVMPLKLAETQTLAYVNNILNTINLNERYKAVFFVLPHSENFSTFQTEVRRENTEEARQLEVASYAIYCRHEHFIPVPGGMTAKERAAFIVKKIQDMQ